MDPLVRQSSTDAASLPQFPGIGSQPSPGLAVDGPSAERCPAGESPLPAPEDPARSGLASVGGESLWATSACAAGLQTAGLDRLAAVMESQAGTCMRALADRENWRLVLPLGGRPQVVYLKKHHVRSVWTRLAARLGLRPRSSAGRQEARNVRRLQAAGIPCLELAAYGESLRADGLLESFMISPKLEGFIPLDDFLRQRVQILDRGATTRRDNDLARLVRGVASIARGFHEAGFNHRDLYCCHFFVRERSPGEFEFRLIDLQRVQHRRRFRRRWLVKDLAQLAYSAPRDRVKCTQKIAFIREYFGVARLGPEQKRLIREVLGKQRAMERRLGLIA